jgi:uncharacterized protein YecT (DUF1311 family)
MPGSESPKPSMKAGNRAGPRFGLSNLPIMRAGSWGRVRWSAQPITSDKTTCPNSSPLNSMDSMKPTAILSLALIALARCNAQTPVQVVSPSQLQAVNGLPLNQAVEAREAYKKPLKSAYARQMGQAGKDCEATQGQQPYNVCIGKASELADGDFRTFYNNLQMLCHNRDQLLTLQQSETQWKAYSDSTMKAARAAWPNGTGAPGFVGQVYLSLLRDYMRQLHEIYSLNIAQ